jgi:hypothetical protein
VPNFADNNISVISTSTNTVTGNINLSYANPEYAVISKVAAEDSTTAPMQVTFTILSGALIVTEANVSIYDANTGVFINSDNTDDAGNVIFWLIPGKRYTVNVTGDDVIQSSQSVQVQPTKEQYTINVETQGWSWNPFDWFNTNGTGTTGSADQHKSITGGYKATTITTTGYIEAYYNDTTGNTTSITFQLYHRNTTNNTYVLLNTTTIAANNASCNWTILNSGNKTYRFYANGTNPLYGNVSRAGEHTFYNTPKLNLGWPETFYQYFEILCFLLIGYMSAKRKSVMIAGATFLLVLSWVFLIIGWMSGFGLLVPIMITVFAILLFAYAIAKWRQESGY